MNKAEDKRIQNIARIKLIIIFVSLVLILKLGFHLPWGKSIVFGLWAAIILLILVSRLFAKRYRKEGIRYVLEYRYDRISKDYGSLNITIKNQENFREHLLKIFSLLQQYYASDKFCFIWTEGISMKEKEEIVDYGSISSMLDRGIDFELIKTTDGEGSFYYDDVKRLITIQDDGGLTKYIINKIGGGI